MRAVAARSMQYQYPLSIDFDKCNSTLQYVPALNYNDTI